MPSKPMNERPSFAAKTSLPFIPETPDEFVRLMDMIWAGEGEPAPDGGLTLYMSPWYDDWHNANWVMRELGLVRTGGSFRHGVQGHVYRFPNGQGVWVASHGGAVDHRTNIYGRKK